MKNPQAKVGRVMREFKSGELKSSSGQKVTNPKQAIAIGLSEAGISKKAKGGDMKESKAMMKKEVAFMKKKGAPKSMLKHEMKEAGMKKGGKVKKMAMGGMGQRPPTPMPPNPVSRPPTPMPPNPVSRPPIKPRDIGTGTGPRPTLNKPAGMMKKGGSVKKMAMGGYADGGMPMVMKNGQKVPAFAADGKGKMAKGGLAAGHKAADGIARKGKTKAEQVKMAGGGKTKKYC